MHIVKTVNVLSMILEAPDCDIHFITDGDKVIGTVYLLDACDGLSMEAESGINEVYLIDWQEDYSTFRKAHDNETMYFVLWKLLFLYVVRFGHLYIV